MIPNQRTSTHDDGIRLVLADGHTHAGQPVTIIQAVGNSGYLCRIGDDPTRVTPQYVAADQIREQP